LEEPDELMTFSIPSHLNRKEGTHLSDTIRSSLRRREIGPWIVVAALLACVGCGPGDPVEEAKAYIDQGRIRVAIELLEPVVRKERDNFDAQFYYGLALTLSGEPGAAEWSLRRAMKDPELREAAARMIVGNAMLGNNPAEAVKILTDLIEEEPDSIELLLSRALAYATTRVNLDDALADVERIRELDPTSLDAYRPEILGYLSALMTEEAAAALAALGNRLEEESGAERMASWYCSTMALFAMESGEKELAQERFDACVEVYPEDRAVVQAAADFFHQEKQAARAIEVLENAMALDQGEGDLALAQKLAGILVAEGRIDEAEKLLRDGADSANPLTSLNYSLQLSSLYESQERLDEALEELEVVVELTDSLGMATQTHVFRVGDLAIRVGQLDRALAVASRLDHRPFRLMIQARVAQEREQHAKAISLYKEASRLWPDNEYARYHAARSAEQIGDFEAAIELYRHATRISTETTNAMTRIALLLYAGGRASEALEVLAIQSQRSPLDETGELLRMELIAFAGQVNRIPAYLSRIPPSDSIGIAKRLGPIFRGLRRRGQPALAIELLIRTDPSVFAQPGSDRALEELTRTLSAGTEDPTLEGVTSIMDAAAAEQAESAGRLGVRALIAEERGESPEAIAAAYAAALELDPDLPMALLGRARGHVGEDAGQSMADGLHALEADTVDTERVTELATLLMQAGARDEALELCALVLKRTPFDGLAAQMLASARLASGDHSDQTLDFARRAARFARSERSVTLLRDTYAARGQKEQADELTEQLNRQKARIEKDAEPAPTGTDGA
jgi:tetratricopeptide (TPR) repeat protein